MSQPDYIQEPLLQLSVQQLLQQTTYSIDSKFVIFAMDDLTQTDTNPIDFDLYRSQENVMKRVWDNEADDIWDTDQPT